MEHVDQCLSSHANVDANLDANVDANVDADAKVPTAVTSLKQDPGFGFWPGGRDLPPTKSVLEPICGCSISPPPLLFCWLSSGLLMQFNLLYGLSEHMSVLSW